MSMMCRLSEGGLVLVVNWHRPVLSWVDLVRAELGTVFSLFLSVFAEVWILSRWMRRLFDPVAVAVVVSTTRICLANICVCFHSILVHGQWLWFGLELFFLSPHLLLHWMGFGPYVWCVLLSLLMSHLVVDEMGLLAISLGWSMACLFHGWSSLQVVLEWLFFRLAFGLCWTLSSWISPFLGLCQFELVSCVVSCWRWRYCVFMCSLSKAVSNVTNLMGFVCWSLVLLVSDCLPEVSVEIVCLFFWTALVWSWIFFFQLTDVLFTFVVTVAWLNVNVVCGMPLSMSSSWFNTCLVIVFFLFTRLFFLDHCWIQVWLSLNLDLLLSVWFRTGRFDCAYCGFLQFLRDWDDVSLAIW